MGTGALWGFLHKGTYRLFYKNSDGYPSALGRSLAKQFRFLNLPYVKKQLDTSVLVDGQDVVTAALYKTILDNSPCPETLETDEMHENIKLWVQAVESNNRRTGQPVGHGPANLRATEEAARNNPKTYAKVLRNVQANIIGSLATGVHECNTITGESIVDYIYVFDLDAKAFRILPMEFDGEQSRAIKAAARSVPFTALFDNDVVMTFENTARDQD